jgi:SAM-dependent methyltransferase
MKVTKYLPKEAIIIDAGCAPGFTSLALRLLGFEVFCLDIEPEPYKEILENQGCKVFKVDLERDSIPLPTDSVDGVIFTEVLEHLSPYCIPWTMHEINRTLKVGGYLFLSTPNVVSIGKRVKVILGKNPIGKKHVKEYTMDEVKELVEEAGFSVEECYYSLAYDTIPYYPNYPKGEGYLLTPFKALFKYPCKENLFKALVLPLVYIKRSFRATIFIIGRKQRSLSQPIAVRRF